MATVTGLTAERMLEIEAASVVDGAVSGDNLILTKHDGSTIDAGSVRGPQGEIGDTGYDTAPIGAVITHTSQTIPAEYLLANGQSVSEDDYPQLAVFAAAEVAAGSTLYAVSGAFPHRTITIPDLTDRFIFSKGTKVFGAKSGAETVQLTSAESGLPAHTHTVPDGSVATATSNGSNTLNHNNGASDLARGDGSNNGGAYAFGIGPTNANAGAAAASAHNNMPPYCVLAFLIKAKGANGSDLSAYAPLVSPAFTGSPTAPTQAADDNSTKLATTAYVDRIAQGLGIPNTQAATYTPTLADAGKVIELNAAGATTFNLPLNSAVPFPIGTIIIVRRIGAGAVTLHANTGAIQRNRIEPAGTTDRTIANQWSEVSYTKRATNEWVLVGDIS